MSAASPHPRTHLTRSLETLWGGYSPLRRIYRRLRPPWMGRLTPAGSAIDRFVGEIGLTVRHGPFAQMRFPARAGGRASFLAAKLLGAYEREIHPALLGAIAARPPLVVDVGAADGYYAVGLALRLDPETPVHAFETDGGSRRLCREMAELNGVADRLHVRGACDPDALAAVLRDRAFVLCDCEGYEVELLDPARVPQLETCTILAELHPLARAGVEATIRDRFARTHRIVVHHPEPRDQADWAELAGRDPDTAFLLLSEGAPSPDRMPEFRRCWALLTPLDLS
jgi:hypothetical protein